MTPVRSFLSAIFLLALRHAAATADMPILHGGEAPQVGVVRIYDQHDIPVYRYEILKKYAHDTADYTEALFMHDGFVYEGTGGYANIWQTDYIVRFSAATGKVNGWIDLSGLNPNPERLVYPHVLNGIAYTGEPGTLLVTGKNWPSLWHIKLKEVRR